MIAETITELLDITQDTRSILRDMREDAQAVAFLLRKVWVDVGALGAKHPEIKELAILRTQVQCITDSVAPGMFTQEDWEC